jgi:hypothetical protein
MPLVKKLMHSRLASHNLAGKAAIAAVENDLDSRAVGGVLTTAAGTSVGTARNGRVT